MNVLQVPGGFNKTTIMNCAYRISQKRGKFYLGVMGKDNIISLYLSLCKKRKLRCLRWVQRKLEGATPSWSSYQLVKMQIVLFCLAESIDSALSGAKQKHGKNAKHSFIGDADIFPFMVLTEFHNKLFRDTAFTSV